LDRGQKQGNKIQRKEDRKEGEGDRNWEEVIKNEISGRRGYYKEKHGRET
jgi:hypothetical protein